MGILKENKTITILCPCCEISSGWSPAYILFEGSKDYWCGYCKHQHDLKGKILKKNNLLEKGEE